MSPATTTCNDARSLSGELHVLQGLWRQTLQQQSQTLQIPLPGLAECQKPACFGRTRYGALPPQLNQLQEQLQGLPSGVQQVALRLAISRHLREPEGAPGGLDLPTSVAELQRREGRRILEALRDSTAQIDLGQDRWRKNVAILDGRLLPMGAEFADPSAGVPRRLLVSGGLLQRLRAVRCMLTETGGFKPMLELHAHPDSLAEFNPEGWLNTYLRLAETLELNPQFRGVMASSWFRDPQLATISPRLLYLRDVPRAHGAHMFHVADDPGGRSGALARSPTRQRLFAEGRYVPKIYMMIWPRQALLAWARQQRALHT